MARISPKRGVKLGHRDILRCRLILEALSGAELEAGYLTDHYYRDVSPASFHKTFKRDRDAMATQGIYLTENLVGTAKYWTLDRARTLADLSSSDDANLRAAAVLLRSLLTDAETPSRQALAQAAAHIGRTVGGQGTAGTTSTLDEETLQTLDALVRALRERRPCRIGYTSVADGEPRPRVVHPYGIFELNDTLYLVALRAKGGERSAIRTFNLGRIASVDPLDHEPPYEIPKEFNVEDYRLLPFELGSDPAYEACFFVPRAAASSFRSAARRRGSAKMHHGGALEWRIWVRDTRRAAQWAAQAGLLPESPEHLVKAWEQLLEEALGDE